jgi:hypothetical protein
MASFDPVKQINALFAPPEDSARQSHPLDKLYLGVLRQKYPMQIPEHAKHFGAVMACVLAARQPLSIEALKALTGQRVDDGAS